MSFLRVPLLITTGLRSFTRSGYERAAKSFDPADDSARLDGVAVLVTGANQGLGLETSLQLAQRGATVYMGCRNGARGLAAVEEVRTAAGHDGVHLCIVDVSSLSSTAALGREFDAAQRPLHCLVNNAGIMQHGKSAEDRSVDGYEINFATNTLGSLAVTRALQPALQRGAALSGLPSRVIFVSSGGALTEHLEIDDLEGKSTIRQGGDFATVQYARDKRRQIALAEALNREWTARSMAIAAYSCHPGWTVTEGVKKSIPKFHETFGDRMRSPQQGADTIVWLAAAKSDRLELGAFYLDRKPRSKHLAFAGTKYADDRADSLLKKLDVMIDKGGGGSAAATAK